MSSSLFLAACSVLILSLAGCGTALKQGTLVKKVHEPERSWVQMMPITTGSVTALIPIVHEDDEDWVFVIEDSSPASKRSRQCKIYVSQEVFARHQEGDWIEVADLGAVRDDDKPARQREPRQDQSG